MADISIWQLLIIALIVIVLFGTKKLSGIGSDLGTAIQGFKKSLKEEPATGNSSHDNNVVVTESHSDTTKDINKV
ncbi:twin-arginine translocase TatA/TatE family subunit [Vibrio marisflavi]|uniref:Sec-independent protein translocase protein TatA n=1 Tax=Vibrio marisflavi CECT 7928 TaxID=634439 RepID=A0ABM8ZZX7_9VIBR|nr:Sec-independent protein translocase protein TatA [Vibrio marisflavi CECT 7928]